MLHFSAIEHDILDMRVGAQTSRQLIPFNGTHEFVIAMEVVAS